MLVTILRSYRIFLNNIKIAIPEKNLSFFKRFIFKRTGLNYMTLAKPTLKRPPFT